MEGARLGISKCWPDEVSDVFVASATVFENRKGFAVGIVPSILLRSLWFSTKHERHVNILENRNLDPRLQR